MALGTYADLPQYIIIIKIANATFATLTMSTTAPIAMIALMAAQNAIEQ
jgi:hypothetical protein